MPKKNLADDDYRRIHNAVERVWLAAYTAAFRDTDATLRLLEQALDDIQRVPDQQAVPAPVPVRRRPRTALDRDDPYQL